LQLVHADVRVGELVYARLRIFELHRCVAQIEAQSKVVVQSLPGFILVSPVSSESRFAAASGEQMIAEKATLFLHRFEHAAGFGLDRERNALLPVRPFNALQVRGMPHHEIDDALHGLGRACVRFKGAGHGADAADQVLLFRQQICQQVRQQVGVVKPFDVLPVGQIDSSFTRLPWNVP
jgi:hypothetical protein